MNHCSPQPSASELHLMLDEKIQEVARMRSVLAKQLRQINLISSVKEQIIQSSQSLLLYLTEVKYFFKDLSMIPSIFEEINGEWGRVVYEIKMQHSKEIEEIRIKCKNEVKEVETELRKQYDITHHMKNEVETLKKLIEEYMANNSKQENDTSPIKSMEEKQQPALEVIIEEEEITSTKRGDDPADQSLENILERARTEQKLAHKEYITLGNLHDMVRTNSAEKPLCQKKLDLNSIDVYYKKNRIYYPAQTEQSKSELTISDGCLNDLELETLGKIINKSAKEKLFSNRRNTTENKKSTTLKDVLSIIESEEFKTRGLHSFRDRTNKQNIEDASKEKSPARQLSKEEKYKTMIKNILTSKEKDFKKKKEFILNIGDRRMEVKYEGSKREGKRHGKGILYYNNGLSYEGEFKNNQRSGYGVLRFNHIEIYGGDWENDSMNGEGRVKNCSIIGSKKKDLPLILQRWISYSGEFKNNKFQGSGTLFMAGGQKYLGMFRNGFPCNQGTLYKSTGQVQFGQWRGNIFIPKY